MNLKDIFNYNLVSVGKFSINAFDLFISVVIIIISIFLLRLIKKFFNNRVKAGKIDKGSAFSIYSIIKYLIWIIVILMILETMGVNLNLMLAGSAALLVGLGFGIQQIFNDLVSGIILLFEGNLKVGDVIQLENNIIGRVRVIGLRTSKIITRDDIIMIVPNSKFISDQVINWSHEQGSTRFLVEVGVAYGSDTELVTRLLLECANLVPEVDLSPEPFVRFNDFGDSALIFQLLFWTKETFRSEYIRSKIRYAIDRKFRENNITIPFPQRDVHMISDKK
ncbi:mechanosensitive ion channel domain-containing protein [Lentimicrobium sp.]|uniref:mechanosensitive ion channel family protein n=1 Tax=Lentimicrobium sp. TaxID=2034841 RepID=UPI002CF4C52F|nr:mechanosensitive ion channel domain-containing protein [Lentimicrobium sp.]HOP14915.1 mechanosensitive ion channel [Lentimicrobium sp.]HPF63467.1 mechanosensitive ion channel [Lentimicrobium sp.]HPR25229.1 mechanosensitive ion channel [Lentimicrobium sp.]HRW67965.1 mechanosensitive ion channel [Lentimicrobium sp.]